MDDAAAPLERGYEQALSTLNRYIQVGRAGQRFDTPQQVVASCQKMGIDLSRLRAIHVAGTKGKGSTSAFTERILRQAGLRTGLYTSPHLVDIRERVRINGQILPKDTFARYFWTVHDRLSSEQELHFFHFLTVLGFYIFQQVAPSLLPQLQPLQPGHIGLTARNVRAGGRGCRGCGSRDGREARCHQRTAGAGGVRCDAAGL